MPPPHVCSPCMNFQTNNTCCWCQKIPHKRIYVDGFGILSPQCYKDFPIVLRRDVYFCSQCMKIDGKRLHESLKELGDVISKTTVLINNLVETHTVKVGEIEKVCRYGWKGKIQTTKIPITEVSKTIPRRKRLEIIDWLFSNTCEPCPVPQTSIKIAGEIKESIIKLVNDKIIQIK